MQPSLQAALSCSLTFGVPLGLALLELRNLRRGGGWRPDRIPDEHVPRPLPPSFFVPPREPGTPTPQFPRVRVLERVE
jgi:hypothetical protein